MRTSCARLQYPFRKSWQISALGFTLTCKYGQSSREHIPSKKNLQVGIFSGDTLCDNKQVLLTHAPCKNLKRNRNVNNYLYLGFVYLGQMIICAGSCTLLQTPLIFPLHLPNFL